MTKGDETGRRPSGDEAGPFEPAPWAVSAEDDDATGGPRVSVPAGFVRAGSVARVVALVLDTLIVAFIAFVIAVASGAVLGLDSARDQDLLVALLYGAGTASSAFYFAGFWSGPSQATPGMRLFALRLGRADDGGALSVPVAIARWVVMGAPLGALLLIPGLGAIVSLAGFALGVVLLASTLLSATRQGLHDRAARSLVVQRSNAPTRELAACLVVVIGIVAASALAFVVLLFINQRA